jgi:hypothetical protein
MRDWEALSRAENECIGRDDERHMPPGDLSQPDDEIGTALSK